MAQSSPLNPKAQPFIPSPSHSPSESSIAAPSSSPSSHTPEAPSPPSSTQTNFPADEARTYSTSDSASDSGSDVSEIWNPRYTNYTWAAPPESSSEHESLASIGDDAAPSEDREMSPSSPRCSLAELVASSEADVDDDTDDDFGAIGDHLARRKCTGTRRQRRVSLLGLGEKVWFVAY